MSAWTLLWLHTQLLQIAMAVRLAMGWGKRRMRWRFWMLPNVEEISLSDLTTRHFAGMLTKMKAVGHKFAVHGSTAWNAWSRMLFVNAWVVQITIIPT